MRKNLTDITVVLDRSGSMGVCRTESENGINHFIEEQKKEDGETIFSLVQFDTEYEFVHKGVSIQDVPKFTLRPRGLTALLDAVGKAINETVIRLADMDEADLPGLVVFVIVTDGGENASHEFTKSQIKELIEKQQNKFKWQFTFLGANQDAFAEGSGIGIMMGAIANYNINNTKHAFSASSDNVSRMRTCVSGGQEVVNCYTDAEKVSMS